MILDFVRLALATVVVLLPGRLVARALGQRSVSAMLAWAVAALFVSWGVVFVVHGSAGLALTLLLAIGLAALLAARRRRLPARPRLHLVVLVLGIVLGVLLWHVAGVVSGDGLFHLARVRKLVELGGLHLRTVDEFRDGGLHPGYAFPLWHGFLALVSSVSGLDPATVVNHEASLLAPLACLVAWEAGTAVFGTAAAGLSTLAASLGVYSFAAGHGGSFASLALPATASRQLLVPAGLTLFFSYAESRRPQDAAALGALFGGLTLVHPTYALFLLLPLGGYVLVRLGEWRSSLVAFGAALLPTGLALLWLRPIIAETRARAPSSVERARALHQYADQLVVYSPHRFRLAPEVVSRSGAVAVVALLLVPLAALALRRRWGALVLGGFLAVLATMLVPVLFTHASDAVSLSQSRRAAGFAPFAIAVAGGFALLARSVLVVPVALVAGVAFELVWPGDFGPSLRGGGPALVTWFALLGGAVALSAALVLRRPPLPERHALGAAATALFVLPVAVHGFAHWSPAHGVDAQALSPALLRTLRNEVPARSVVLAPPGVSYRLLAAAPIYVVAAPVAHVANTDANRPYERRRDVARWFQTKEPSIPRAYGVTWVVERGRLRRLR